MSLGSFPHPTPSPGWPAEFPGPAPRPPSPTDSILCLVRALGDVGMAGRAGGRVDKTEGAAYTFDEEGADGPGDSEGSSAWGQTQGREDTGEQARSEEKGFT